MTKDDSNTTRRTYLKSTAVAGAAGMAGLSGCLSGMGGGGDGGGDGEKLEILHGWSGGDGKAAFNALHSGFEEKHPDAKTKVQPVGGGGNTDLNTLISKRLGNDNPPGSWADWPGKNLLQFTSEGILGDIGTDVWGKNGMKDAYLDGPKKAAKPDGKFVAVPLNIHRMNNLFYNKKVVKKAGVDPSSIESPKDLTAALKKVDENTNAVGMAQSTKGPWTTLQLWASVFLAEAGWDSYQQFMKGKGKQSEIESAFKTLADYSKYFSNDASTIGWKEANKMVIDGKAAFIHQGDWAAGMYSGQDFTFEEDWGHVPFPGTDGYYAMNMDSFVFPKDGPAPETAKKFLRYCGTKEGQVKFNTKKGSIPPRDDVSTEKFGKFQTAQIEEFRSSKAQPPSIAHGLGVKPDVLTNLNTALKQKFSSYSDENASKVAKAFTNAF
ncbi:carbohydrate ABC transporter substrate-binding protein [halophilic archaeon]|nr:carbohydrate ABC transporter substrate-binding protein [halophilic archaeon]